MVQHDVAFQLAALAKAGHDGGDEQLLRVSVDMGVQPHAPGDHAGSNVIAVHYMNRAIGAEDSHLPGSGQIKAGNAARGKRIPEDRIEQCHVQVALCLGLPAGMGEVFKRSRDQEGMSVGREAQRAQIGCSAQQVQRGFNAAARGLGSDPCVAAEEVQVGGSGFNAVALGVGACRGNIANAQGDVAGVQIEQLEAILKVEGGCAVLVVEFAFLHGNVAGLQIEKAIENGLACLAWLARLGLVGRTAGVDDQVERRTEDLQVAEQNLRTPEAENADLQAQALHLGIRRLSGCFKAVNHDPAGIGLEAEQMPMKRCDLHTPAGSGFQPGNRLLANQILKGSRVGPDAQ